MKKLSFLMVIFTIFCLFGCASTSEAAKAVQGTWTCVESEDGMEVTMYVNFNSKSKVDISFCFSISDEAWDALEASSGSDRETLASVLESAMGFPLNKVEKIASATYTYDDATNKISLSNVESFSSTFSVQDIETTVFDYNPEEDVLSSSDESGEVTVFTRS